MEKSHKGCTQDWKEQPWVKTQDFRTVLRPVEQFMLTFAKDYEK